MIVQATPPSFVKQPLTFEEIVGQHAGAIADCNVRIKDARLAQEQARANQARALQGYNEAQRKLEVAAKNRQDLLTQIFHTIFSKNPLPVEEVDVIFNKYLAEKDLVMLISADRKSVYPKLISMRAIIRYLNDHPGLKLCDFREFNAEIHDIPTLAEYLSKTGCTIKAIAISQAISASDKASLQKAVTERKGGLKVQYSA